MDSLMYLLRKLLSLICFVGAASGAIRFINASDEQTPYSLFSTILWSYWGCIMWKKDNRMIAINGFLYTLLIIVIFIAELFVCMMIGTAISGLIANFNPTLAGWIFAISMTFCLFVLPPSKVLPKKVYINQESNESNKTEESNEPKESDHSRYMPKSNDEE